jgi:hypothetical protein
MFNVKMLKKYPQNMLHQHVKVKKMNPESNYKSIQSNAR